jgi:hypothetical protein
MSWLSLPLPSPVAVAVAAVAFADDEYHSDHHEGDVGEFEVEVEVGSDIEVKDGFDIILELSVALKAVTPMEESRSLESTMGTDNAAVTETNAVCGGDCISMFLDEGPVVELVECSTCWLGGWVPLVAAPSESVLMLMLVLMFVFSAATDVDIVEAVDAIVAVVTVVVVDVVSEETSGMIAVDVVTACEAVEVLSGIGTSVCALDRGASDTATGTDMG